LEGEAGRLHSLKSSSPLNTCHLSAHARNFLAEYDTADSSPSVFKPFLNERDALNRLIGAPRTYDPTKKEQTILDVLKRIQRLERKAQAPNVCLQVENTFDSTSLTGPYGLFKKKSNEMKHIKRRILPTNNQKYEQEMVLNVLSI
jgi:hypothetical protein